MSELAPATLEGWYALHQMFSVDWAGVRALAPADRDRVVDDLRRRFAPPPADAAQAGWSAAFRLVGGGADWMFVHFRESLDTLSEAGQAVRRSPAGELLDLTYDYLSVTEAGLYHATAEAAAEAEPGTPAYQKLIAEAAEAERGSPHLVSRLYPQVPDGMRYVSFYPMSKRRASPDNWYALPVAERNRLMREHGLTGRRYAGRIFQIITGSVGFDDWEWGVTLFAHDPLEFKRIVTEMRYDEASTKYGEFGEFFTGIRIEQDAWGALIAGD